MDSVVGFELIREIVAGDPPYEWLMYALMYYNGKVPPEVVVEYVKRNCGYVPVYMWQGEERCSFLFFGAYNHGSDFAVSYTNVGGFAVKVGFLERANERSERAAFDVVRAPLLNDYWTSKSLVVFNARVISLLEAYMIAMKAWINGGAPSNGQLVLDVLKWQERAKESAWREGRGDQRIAILAALRGSAWAATWDATLLDERVLKSRNMQHVAWCDLNKKISAHVAKGMYDEQSTKSPTR